MNLWLNHHKHALQLVLKRMLDNRLSNLMIFIVFSVALCLPSLFYIAVDNIAQLTNHMQQETEVSVFLKLNATEAELENIRTTLISHAAVKAHVFVSKDEAWAQLKAKTTATGNTSDPLLQLNKNPLPDAFFVQMVSTDKQRLQAFQQDIQSLAGVSEVLVNAEWVDKLNTLLALGKKVVFFTALLLASVLLIVVGNTIRMQIITQKDEIEVSKLMGATNPFIKVPFLYAGILYGVVGGLLALLMVSGIVYTFNASIAPLSALYHSDFSLHIDYLKLAGMVMGGAILIGWLGAYFAVTRTINTFKIY